MGSGVTVVMWLLVITQVASFGITCWDEWLIMILLVHSLANTHSFELHNAQHGSYRVKHYIEFTHKYVHMNGESRLRQKY